MFFSQYYLNLSVYNFLFIDFNKELVTHEAILDSSCLMILINDIIFSIFQFNYDSYRKKHALYKTGSRIFKRNTIISAKQEQERKKCAISNIPGAYSALFHIYIGENPAVIKFSQHKVGLKVSRNLRM